MLLFWLCSYYHTFLNLLLFFGFAIALEINLSHLVVFIAAVVVLIVIAQFILILTVVAQHGILDIGTDCVATTLRWEAHTANHAGMLILFTDRSEEHTSELQSRVDLV